MNIAEFDQYADDYADQHQVNIKRSGETPDFFAAYKINDIASVLDADGMRCSNLSILDFGVGIGSAVPHFRQHFRSSNLFCLDVSHRSIHLAHQRFPDDARFIHFDGKSIPFLDQTFDIVYVACVFHHIDHDSHNTVLIELRRVLKPDGYLFVFEHNPLNPLTLHAVNTCPFDKDAKLIYGTTMKKRLQKAGFFNTSLRYRIFFPGQLAAFRPLEKYLSKIPLGAQYYVLGH